ncbi:unnamed protein product [Tenebrio molitor]|nr:unnamed protein product [Tenebrio molitor]
MTPTTIDLILSNNIDNLQKPLSLPELDSDHNPVKTVLSGQQKEVRQQTKISYKKTDWKIFRDTLNSAIQINNSIPDITALEQAVVKFTKIIQKAIEINTYKVTLNKNQESEIITPQVKEKIKNRNKLKRIWQRTQHPGIKEQINKLNHKIRNEIKTNRSNVWDKKLEDIKSNDDTLYKISSILGPKLFSIYINDIPKFTKTNLALYADDTAVYAHSFNAEVANKQVQIQVNLLEDYFDKWLIGINSAKTETILFSKKFTNNKIITPLKLKEQKIQTKPSVKYLGVHLDSRLTFHTHVNKTLEKARKTFNALFPLMNKKSKLSNQNKIKIYKTIIRPVVTYAAPVWCNISKTTLIPLQRFQNKCLRFATGSGRYTKTVTLHDTANVEMLRAHINRLSTGFYRNRIGHNPLTNDITNTHKTLKRTKHKLPYSTLDLSD